MEIQKWQTKSIYALAGSLGMVKRGSHDDALHALVSGMTGAASVTQLDSNSANDVLAELRSRMALANRAAAPVCKPVANKAKDYYLTPTGPTKEQIDKIWALMYDLRKYDTTPIKTSLGSRVAGIIKHQFGIDAGEEKPFSWLSRQQGHMLIDTLKGYVDTARRRAMRKEGVSDGS